jgi:hypothetical protein
MKKMNARLAPLLSLFLLFVGLSFGADLLDEVANALRSGDAKSVSRYFGSSVDLSIASQEDVYSKTQAEQVLKDFFSKNQPRSFTILHKGESKEGAKYAIGRLLTAQGVSYRTYFYVKAQGNTPVIQELQFMKE